MLTRSQALSKATMLRDFAILKALPDGDWE
jgi:hypothetical protein